MFVLFFLWISGEWKVVDLWIIMLGLYYTKRSQTVKEELFRYLAEPRMKNTGISCELLIKIIQMDFGVFWTTLVGRPSVRSNGCPWTLIERSWRWMSSDSFEGLNFVFRSLEKQKEELSPSPVVWREWQFPPGLSAFVCLSDCLFVCLFVCLLLLIFFVCLFVYLSAFVDCLFVCLFVSLFVCWFNSENIFGNINSGNK